MPQASGLPNLFAEHIYEIYSAEEQIATFLPKIIEVSSSSELRKAFNHYLEEIKHHQESIKKILVELKLEHTGIRCEPVEGMIEEIEIIRQRGGNSPVKDAGLIAGVQRLQHFKIALYGTARTYARHLNHNKAMDLLQKALNEEGEADRQLTRLAEGGVFTTGINEEACNEQLTS